MKLKGRVERVTQLVDIFPTFAALFGEKRYFDGQSLLDSISVKKEDGVAVATDVQTPRRYLQDNFSPKWYLSAFPSDEINKGYGLIQNPGWEQ